MKKLPKMISKPEAVTLLYACNVKTHSGLRNRCMLELMYRCGLRVSEVCDLESAHIVWAERMVEVRDGSEATKELKRRACDADQRSG